MEISRRFTSGPETIAKVPGSAHPRGAVSRAAAGQSLELLKADRDVGWRAGQGQAGPPWCHLLRERAEQPCQPPCHGTSLMQALITLILIQPKLPTLGSATVAFLSSIRCAVIIFRREEAEESRAELCWSHGTCEGVNALEAVFLLSHTSLTI